MLKWFLVFPLACLSLSTASWAQLIDPVLEWEWGYGMINPQYVTANLDSEATKELVFGNAQGRFYILGRQDTNYVVRYKSRWFGGTPVPVGAYDFDVNGRSDLVVVAGGRLRLFENQPGRYAEKFSLDLGGLGYRGGAVGDVDRDGQTEVCLGLSDGKIHLYIWQGNALVKKWQGSVPASADMVIADTDRDSTNEVVVRGYVLGWNGSGFATEWSQTGGSFWTAGDVDGDGMAEVVYQFPYSGFWVYKWNGSSYAQMGRSGTIYADAIGGIHCGDTDNDGRDEVCAEFCMMNNPHACLDEIDIFGWNGSAFVGEGGVWLGDFVGGFGVGDVSGDGRAEVIVQKPMEDLLIGSYVAHGPGQSLGLGVGDTDGDARLEMVTWNPLPTGHVLGWDGTKYRMKALFPPPTSAQNGTSVVVGELDSRPKREIGLGWGYDDASPIGTAFYGDTAGIYQLRRGIWQGFNQQGIADVDRDGQNELVGIAFDNLDVWSWQDTGMVHEWSGARDANAFALGDVDGDTTVEIVVVYDSLWVLGWNGSAYLVEGHGPGGSYTTTGVAVGDVDGNGRPDIVVTTGTTGHGQILIYEWSGTTYALKWSSPDLGKSAFGPTTGNVIGTATQEFFFCQPSPTAYRYNDSTWVQFWSGDTLATASPAWLWISIYNGMAVADLDGDGTNELACASDGYVHVLSFQYSGVAEGAEARAQRQGFNKMAVPNPFVSFASVPGHEEERFGLYDVSGRLVGIYLGDKIGWNAGPGVYFLKLLNNRSAPMRIVKVK
jgi:hypothetical protein